MAAKDDKAIEAAYGKKKPLYESLCREVVVNLEELVKESGIALEVPIESRVLHDERDIGSTFRKSGSTL